MRFLSSTASKSSFCGRSRLLAHTLPNRRLLVCAFALCLAVATLSVAGLSTDDAWGDVRRTDVIAGASIEERGITAADCPSIDASYSCVVDDQGTVYYERDSLTPAHIASITKVMTAMISLDIAQGEDDSVSLDTPITVSAQAASIGESTAQLLAGDSLTVHDALKALMIPSGNDAAEALAEDLGAYLVEGEASADQALAAFVGAMNDKAAELGCTDTVFENPHGLDSDAYAGDLHSTASDLGKIVVCAMENEVFREIVDTGNTTITVTRNGAAMEIPIATTDTMLDVYEGACGIKTGYTETAGSCFAGAANRGDGYVYAIVLNSTSDDQRFTDAEALFDWVYNNRITYWLAQSDETTTMTLDDDEEREVPVVAKVSHTDWTDKTVKATFADPDAAVEVFALSGNVSEEFEFDEVKGRVRTGDVIGQATFYQNDAVVATQDLVAAEDVKAPNIFRAFGIWWKRVFGGSPKQAESVVLNDTPLIYDKQA